MWLLVSLAIPVVVFLVAANFLGGLFIDGFLVISGVLGLVALAVSLETLNTRESIKKTLSILCANIPKSVIFIVDSVNQSKEGRYWWTLWLPYFVVLLGVKLTTLINDMGSILYPATVIITAIVSIIISIKDSRRRRKSNLGFVKTAMIPAVICSVFLFLFVVMLILVSIYGFPRIH